MISETFDNSTWAPQYLGNLNWICQMKMERGTSIGCIEKFPFFEVSVKFFESTKMLIL